MKRREPILLPPSKPRSGKFGFNPRSGKVGWAVLWLLGVPLPVLLLIYVLRGCS